MSDREQCWKCKFLASTEGHKAFFCNYPVPDWVENPTQVVDQLAWRSCAAFEDSLVKKEPKP